ncbi:hypothetical protein EMIT0P74_100026 [Pseudomonas sp. IT-P74]
MFIHTFQPSGLLAFSIFISILESLQVVVKPTFKADRGGYLEINNYQKWITAAVGFRRLKRVCVRLGIL